MSDTILELILLVAIAAPALGGALSTIPPLASGRWATMSTAVALLAAAVIVVAAGGSASPSWEIDGRLMVEADRLGALLLLFVLAATLVVQAYAVRSLRGDLWRHRFFVASGFAASATATVVVAADLWVLVVGWLAVSLATVALLRHDARPTANAAAGRALRAFALGDAVLIGAAIVAGASAGTVTLRPTELDELAANAPQVGGVGVVGVLALAAVVAAVTRCALPPAQSWLPMSVAAPTPSSAVLHAGIVNGGGVLLIRFAPLVAVSWAPTAIAVTAGCAGVLVGGAVARTRPDVKTGLAWSTVAQMGFMVVQCVTGLLGPALVHMVAHGMYKANLFLGSGSTLGHTHPARPDPGGHPARVAGTAAVTAVVVGAAWLIVRPASFDGAAGLVFAGFVAATVAQVVWAWSRSRPSRSALDVAAFAALLLATIAAVALAGAIKSWLGPSLPEVTPPTGFGAGALALTGVVALAVGIAAQRATVGSAPGVRRAELPVGPPSRRPGPPGAGHVPWRGPAMSASPSTVRARSIAATDTLPPTFPIGTFVAANPLRGLEHLPFERAAHVAALSTGARSFLRADEYRELHDQGRITDGHLRAALDAALARDRSAGARTGLRSDGPRRGGTGPCCRRGRGSGAAAGSAHPFRAAVRRRCPSRLEGSRRAPSWPIVWMPISASGAPRTSTRVRPTGSCPVASSVCTRPGGPWRHMTPGWASWSVGPRAGACSDLPDGSAEALAALVTLLRIADDSVTEYFRASLRRVPGWASALARSHDSSDIVGFLALRLTLEYLAVGGQDVGEPWSAPQLEQAEVPPWLEHLATWQEALELGYRDHLVGLVSLHVAADRSSTRAGGAGRDVHRRALRGVPSAPRGGGPLRDAGVRRVLRPAGPGRPARTRPGSVVSGDRGTQGDRGRGRRRRRSSPPSRDTIATSRPRRRGMRVTTRRRVRRRRSPSPRPRAGCSARSLR